MIELRPFEESHLPEVLGWVNSDAVRDTIGTVRPVSMTEHRRWYERVQGDPTRLTLVIHDAESNAPRGLIGLTGIDPVYRNAEVWLYLGEAGAQRRGHGRAALLAMVGLAFDTLNLHRVYAHVFDSNEPARRFFVACGFREEGRLREAVFKKGRWVDKHVLGLLAHER